jgi:hypothetical protein
VELESLHRALKLIIKLTSREIKVEIAEIGGVEVVVKVMKTFPKCPALQYRACCVLRKLVSDCSIGKTNAIESGGIEAVLAAIDNHLLGSVYICKTACWALFNIVIGSKEKTELLISLGGVAAVLKVRTQWPDIGEFYEVRQLTAQMTAPQPTVRISCMSSEVTIASLKVPAFSSLPTATKVATDSTKVPALSFPPTAVEDTTVSSVVPTLSSQSTLGKVPAVPASAPRSECQLPEATPEVVSQQPRHDRKCKSTEAPEAVVLESPEAVVLEPPEEVVKESPEAVVLESTGEGERHAMKIVTRSSLNLRERKSQDARMMNAATSTVASLQMKAQVVTEKDSISSQSTLGIYHDSSDGASPLPKVPTVPSTPRNDNQLKPETTLELESEQPRNDRKCKSTEALEAVVLESTGEGERNAMKVVTRSSLSLRERKPHDTHTDASTSPVASPQMNTQVSTERDSTADAAVSTSNTEQEESTANAEPEHQIQSIGALIQDLFYSDNITFDAALHALGVDLLQDSTK